MKLHFAGWSRKENAGFLLFEVLISLLILSFGMAGLIRAFHHILEISDRAEQSLQALFYTEEMLVRFQVEKVGESAGGIPEVSQYFRDQGFEAELDQEELDQIETSRETQDPSEDSSQKMPLEHRFTLNKLKITRQGKPALQLEMVMRESLS